MRARLGAIAVLVGAFAYFVAFRRYGFQVEDEGTLLFQLARVAHGQHPYVDFHTGYTPGFFAIGARAFALLGFSTAALRPALALVNALSAAALYLLARAFVGPWMAALPPLLWVAFIPVYPGEFAAFAVPYPSWLATLAWLGVALALVGWMRRGRHLRLVAAGVGGALAFSVKPNAGAFALAATVWVAAIGARRVSAADRASAAAASVVMVLGVWAVFGFTSWSVDAAVHLAPVAVLAALCAGPLAARGATDEHPRALVAISIVAAAFLGVTLLWLVPVARSLGLASTLRDVLLIGSGYAELYYTSHPPPELYAAAVVGAAVGLAVAGWLVNAGRLSPWVPLGVAAASLLALGLRLARSAVMPESAASSLAWQLENAAFWLAPLANWGGLAILIRRAASGNPPESSRAVLALPPLAVAMYLQLYPRSDFMHLVCAVPITMVLATVLLATILAWWTEARSGAAATGRRAVHALLATAVLVVLAVKIGPVVHALASSTGEDRALVATPTTMVAVEPEASDDLTAFGKAAEFLIAHTQAGEPALAFPALTGLLFAARLTSPVPHDYWFPGRPDHAGEQHMIAALEQAPPRFVVTLNDGWTFFSESTQYFRTTREFVVRRYRLAARFGRYDILGRNDVTNLGGLLVWQPTGSGAAVLEPRLALRRQAARRWMAALTVEEARRPALEAAPREAILRLRALRDGGDLRTAGWLVAGYARTDARVQREAVLSMQEVTKRFLAARDRWADDFDAGTYRSYVATYFVDARRLAADPDPHVRAFATALLSLEHDGV